MFTFYIQETRGFAALQIWWWNSAFLFNQLILGCERIISIDKISEVSIFNINEIDRCRWQESRCPKTSPCFFSLKFLGTSVATGLHIMWFPLMRGTSCNHHWLDLIMNRLSPISRISSSCCSLSTPETMLYWKMMKSHICDQFFISLCWGWGIAQQLASKKGVIRWGKILTEPEFGKTEGVQDGHLGPWGPPEPVAGMVANYGIMNRKIELHRINHK